MKILEVVLKVLEVLTKATKLWESDLTPTAHLVVREIFNMQGQLSDLTKFKEGEEVELATELQIEIKERFHQYGTENELLAAGHYTNPNYHGLTLDSVDAMEKTKEFIKSRARKYVLWSRRTTPGGI